MIEQALTRTSAGAVAGVLSSRHMKVWANRFHQKDRVHYEGPRWAAFEYEAPDTIRISRSSDACMTRSSATTLQDRG